MTKDQMLIALVLVAVATIKWMGAKLWQAILFTALGTMIGGTALAIINGGLGFGGDLVGGLLSHVSK